VLAVPAPAYAARVPFALGSAAPGSECAMRPFSTSAIVMIGSSVCLSTQRCGEAGVKRAH
jgi:hypothetical protein